MRRRLTPRFWAFMIALTVLVFGISFIVMQQRLEHGALQLAQAQAYRDQLTLEVQDLNGQLTYVQTDDYIVRAARDKLDMIMPGEVRYLNSAN